MSKKSIEEVKQENTDKWMQYQGVVGVAIGLSQGKPCILVLTNVNPVQIKAKFPEMVESYPVIIQHTDEFCAR